MKHTSFRYLLWEACWPTCSFFFFSQNNLSPGSWYYPLIPSSTCSFNSLHNRSKWKPQTSNCSGPKPESHPCLSPSLRLCIPSTWTFSLPSKLSKGTDTPCNLPCYHSGPSHHYQSLAWCRYPPDLSHFFLSGPPFILPEIVSTH